MTNTVLGKNSVSQRVSVETGEKVMKARECVHPFWLFGFIVTATKNYTLPSIRSKRGVNPPSPPYQVYYYPHPNDGARISAQPNL